MLGHPGALPVCVAKVRNPLPRSGVVLGEAQSESDLQEWAARLDSKTLPAGGAEFFGASLEAVGFRAISARPRAELARSRTRRELFVCGTLAESATAFLKTARQSGMPIFSLPKALARGAAMSAKAMEALAREAVGALRTRQRVVLCIGLPQVHDRKISERLAWHLTEVVAVVLQRDGAGHVYAEGGATAVALARRMGWRRLTVLHELAPGVATLRVAGTHPILFTVKPGSYSWPAAVQSKSLVAV
jgi:uncharacterized protein YgbK (DUF1537 family)